jgi:hypothetical protein
MKLETKFEGSDFGVIEVLSRHLSRGNEENHKKSVRIAGILAQTQTEHFPIACLQRYYYPNPFYDRVDTGKSALKMEALCSPEYLIHITQICQ